MQIKKCNYKMYEQPEGGKKHLVKEGYCYRFFWSRWTAKGFAIPFTLRITKVYHE